MSDQETKCCPMLFLSVNEIISSGNTVIKRKTTFLSFLGKVSPQVSEHKVNHGFCFEDFKHINSDLLKLPDSTTCAVGMRC